MMFKKVLKSLRVNERPQLLVVRSSQLQMRLSHFKRHSNSKNSFSTEKILLGPSLFLPSALKLSVFL